MAKLLENSAESAQFFGQSANAGTANNWKKALPPAARLTLPAACFTESGPASVDSWHGQRHGLSGFCSSVVLNFGSSAFLKSDESLRRTWQTRPIGVMLPSERLHVDTNDINQIVIRNSQLLLSLILSLLLIGVGLIGFGKRTGLAAM
jgi:hypothetical protein